MDRRTRNDANTDDRNNFETLPSERIRSRIRHRAVADEEEGEVEVAETEELEDELQTTSQKSFALAPPYQ